MNNKEAYQPAKTAPRFFYGYFVVAASFLMLVLMFSVFYAFGVFFKPLLTEFGWTRAATSGAFSLNWIMQGFMSIAMGKVNDRFGPRVVLTFCGLLFGLGYLLTSQISALWQLYLFYGVLIGTATSGTFVPLTSTVARWFLKRRSLMTGLAIAGIGIGGFIGPPIANRLISVYDWRVSYMILGGIDLVLVVLLAQFLRGNPAQMGQRPYGEEKGTAVLKEGMESFSIMEAAATRQFWLVSALFFAFGFCLYVVMVHIVPHVTDLGFSTTTAASILATISGLGVIGKVAMGNVGDRIGNRQVFIIAFILMAAALVGLLWADEVLMLYLCVAAFGLAYGGMAVSESPLVAGLFGLESHGLILGVINFGFCIGSALGPYAAGYMFDLTGNYQTSFIAAIVFAAGGLIASLLLRPTKKLGGRI